LTYHRDYPEADARSLHVFGDDTLTLKAAFRGRRLAVARHRIRHIARQTTHYARMYIEMRAKLPYGVGAWPAFWLNGGVQYDKGTFSELPWPPEIDIFEFSIGKGAIRPA